MGRFLDALANLITSLRFFVIVNEYEGGVILRCGRARKTVRGGLHWMMPVIDEAVIKATRSRAQDLGNISVETDAGRVIAASGVLDYEIQRPDEAILNVDDLETSVLEATRGIAAVCVANMDAESEPADIAAEVQEQVQAKVRPWGVRVHEFWFTDFAPHRVFRLLQDARGWDGEDE